MRRGNGGDGGRGLCRRRRVILNADRVTDDLVRVVRAADRVEHRSRVLCDEVRIGRGASDFGGKRSVMTCRFGVRSVNGLEVRVMRGAIGRSHRGFGRLLMTARRFEMLACRARVLRRDFAIDGRVVGDVSRGVMMKRGQMIERVFVMNRREVMMGFDCAARRLLGRRVRGTEKHGGCERGRCENLGHERTDLHFELPLMR